MVAGGVLHAPSWWGTSFIVAVVAVEDISSFSGHAITASMVLPLFRETCCCRCQEFRCLSAVNGVISDGGNEDTSLWPGANPNDPLRRLTLNLQFNGGEMAEGSPCFESKGYTRVGSTARYLENSQDDSDEDGACGGELKRSICCQTH